MTPTSNDFVSNTSISETKPPILVAEIGCNHKGEIEVAREMIRIAKTFCGVDYVKFQKRDPTELAFTTQYRSPHPVVQNSYGATYGEHREFLEFTIEEHEALKAFSEEIGIGYSCSVWDLTSAQEVIGLSPDFIKIPSAMNTHFAMLELICERYYGDIHLSLGMTTRNEEETICDLLRVQDRLKDTVLYHCTSGYPIPLSDVYLPELNRLTDTYGDSIKAVGFSAHYTGIGLDAPAFLLGAQFIERHFTLDRSWKGTDHAASLEPDGLRRVRKDTINLAQALRKKDKEILEIEVEQRKKLKFNPLTDLNSSRAK